MGTGRWGSRTPLRAGLGIPRAAAARTPPLPWRRQPPLTASPGDGPTHPGGRDGRFGGTRHAPGPVGTLSQTHTPGTEQRTEVFPAITSGSSFSVTILPQCSQRPLVLSRKMGGPYLSVVYGLRPALPRREPRARKLLRHSGRGLSSPPNWPVAPSAGLFRPGAEQGLKKACSGPRQ